MYKKGEYPENIIKVLSEINKNQHYFCDIEPPDKLITSCLKELDERHQRLIKKYYQEHKTYKQIGLEEGVTPERIRQLVLHGMYQLNRIMNKKLDLK